MKQEELMLKEMRVSAWEQSHTVPKLAELRDELPEDRSYVIGDLFELRQNNQGNFLIYDNKALSI